MSEKPQIKETEIKEIDLGTRTIEVGGVYYSGKVKVSDAIAKSIAAELAKPELFTLDLGDDKYYINGQLYTGIVKSGNAKMIEQLRYMKGANEGNKRRVSQAHVHPHQHRERADGRSVIQINGTDYVKV